MTEPLTRGTIRRVAVLFPLTQRSEVAQLLIDKCGDNLAFSNNLGSAGIERIRFAVLKLSAGHDRLLVAIKEAQSDWRDTLMAANFGEDITVHLRWLEDA